jgi:hypothetical protein
VSLHVEKIEANLSGKIKTVNLRGKLVLGKGEEEFLKTVKLEKS